jgi:two-component system sensor histidine kinase HydH
MKRPWVSVTSEPTAGIAVLATDLTISSWNREAEQLTGYTLKAVQAIGLEHLFAPAEVMQHLLRQAQEGVATPREYLHLYSADGHLIPVTVQVSPPRHQEHNPWHIEVAFGERGPLPPSPDDREQYRLMNRLASSLSHEIRNPLSTIALYVDLMAESLQHPTSNSHPEMMASVAEIKAEIARLDNLVQGYLALARLEKLQHEPVDLGAVVEDLVWGLQEQLAARGIMLRLQGINDLGQVTVHQQTFSQALLNLLCNAMEAMPQGGTVTLRGTRLDTLVRLEVQDTGRGMPAEAIPWLFMPFHTTKPEGTGLGLYVVQQIVAAHGGEILVTSASGEGTTFTILLPLV